MLDSAYQYLYMHWISYLFSILPKISEKGDIKKSWFLTQCSMAVVACWQGLRQVVTLHWQKGKQR